ncbi:MAG: hypothetical protein LQ340_000421 [Diploschistes diacapsis]|nr:MAG: hypothetical protein LQ340_000421 [Diploschistes diacapsis]
MTSHTVIIASIWEFYDVQSLLQKLEQATGGILARYSYEESKKHFIVKCKPEEESQVTETFFRILREYVNEELRKESNQPNDPFDVWPQDTDTAASSSILSL